MSRYIDCEKCFHYRICCGYTSKEAVAESNRAMNNGESLLCFMYAPTADVVEVRHGHWIDKSRNINGLHDPRLDCSVCGHIFWFQGAETFNYCPACGAKMDGERREENER